MSSYLIYFLIVILVILLAFVIVRLLSQGFKIVYEKPTYRSFNVVKQLQICSKFIIKIV